jgi:uncharacterized FlaG/YvyC family protein
LKEFPAVNGEISGEDIIYKNYYDIGVAVSAPQGLVVPVLRDADSMSMADVEKAIADMGTRARDGKLSMDEMMGGTFTITNGGTFGSMLSTPILNAPQSAILGMHKIQERPMALNGQVVVRPMMYVALSYDHRIIDGKEAVSFLVRVKDAIEDPQRPLIDEVNFPKNKEAIDRLNDQMQKNGRDLRFSMDKELDRPIITVKSSQTGEVVRQIPNEVVIKIAHNIENVKGMLHNKSI